MNTPLKNADLNTVEAATHRFEAAPSPQVIELPSAAANTAAGPRSLTINLEALARAGYLVPEQTRTQLSEEFRHIKRPLLKQARAGDTGNRLSLIMVTSSVPGEGKTFCAINLAMSIAAEIDTSVLLIDADVLRPAIPAQLGVQPGVGLLDVLGDASLPLADAIHSTNVRKLDIMLAGTASRVASELLGSEAMERLLAMLAARSTHQVVIFDASPLLATNEAKVLASRVGQVVMVVEASVTPQSTLLQALEAVEDCPNVSVLLNKSPDPGAGNGYGYY
jgi:protein-tyrosine kinase